MISSIWREEEGKPTGDPSLRRRRRRTSSQTKRSEPGPFRRFVLPALAILLVLLIADGIYVGVRLASSLNSTKNDLDAAKDAFGDARFSVANRYLEDAENAAKSAVQLTKHPSFLLASIVPGIGSDVKATRALSNAADLTSQAGLEALKAVSAMRAGDKGLAASIFRNGTVNFPAVKEGAPFVGRAGELLDEALGSITGVDRPRTNVLRDALVKVSTQVVEASATAAKGTALFNALPRLMGDDGKKSYLLAFQALGESRGTGGLIGLYGILDVEEGKIDLVHVGPSKTVFPVRAKPVKAPHWFAKNYGPQSSLTQFRQANLTPNFPVASQVLLRMYEQQTGVALDGIIAMDPVAFGYMTKGTGPLKAPGIDTQVGPSNAAEVMLKSSYEDFASDAAQSKYLSRLVEAFWQRVHNGDLNERAFAQGLSEAAATNHLKIFSIDQTAEQDVQRMGVAGTFAEAGPSIQLVFQNNYGLNKVDYFLQRTIETTVTLSAEGTAHFTTKVRLANDAPANGVPTLLGIDTPGRSAGTNRLQLNFLLPRDAQAKTIRVNGKKHVLYGFEDTGHPVAWNLLDIGPGKTSEVTLKYDAPTFYSDDIYRLTLVPQTMVKVDSYALRIVPPEGFAFRDQVDASQLNDTFESHGSLDAFKTFEVRLAPKG